VPGYFPLSLRDNVRAGGSTPQRLHATDERDTPKRKAESGNKRRNGQGGQRILFLTFILKHENVCAQMKNAVCKNGTWAGTSRCDVRFSALRILQYALCGFCLVASAPENWLLKILKLRNKPIFETTRNSLQPIMNYNVISDFEPDLSRQFRKNKPI
jgi:hypothetical protein